MVFRVCYIVLDTLIPHAFCTVSWITGTGFVAQLLMSPGLSLLCQPIFEVTSAYAVHGQVAAFILMLHACEKQFPPCNFEFIHKTNKKLSKKPDLSAVHKTLFRIELNMGVRLTLSFSEQFVT